MPPVVAKQMGNPFELFNTKSYEKAMLPMGCGIIGHNRYATQGGVNKANAHPFEFDTLVGVHNGTLKNKHMLVRPGDYAVDSENLYAHMEEHGIKETIAILKGAWSLVWWDKVGRRMNYLRNEERPMYMTITADGDNVFTASEDWMLEGVLSRNRIKHQEIFLTRPDTLISWPVDKDGKLLNMTVVEGYKGAPEMVYGFSGNTGGYSQYGQQVQPQTTQTTGTAGTSAESTSGKKKLALVPKSASDTAYAGRKDVHLEVLGKDKDMNGSSYYICFDPLDVDKNVRLYDNPPRTGTPVNYLYKDIVADISNVQYLENDKRYFKVQVSSITLLEKEAPEVLFATASGRMVDRNKWIELHGECDVCSGFADPEKAHRFTQTGGVVCHDCLEIHNIDHYVALV